MLALCNFLPRGGAETGDVPIHFPLQLVIENDAQTSAAFLVNAGRFLLIEEIQVGVVIGFSRFDEAVVDRLVLRNHATCAHEPVSSPGEREEFARRRFGAFKSTSAHETFPNEILDVHAGPILATSVGVLGEVVRGDDSKLAEFRNRTNFRIT
jgi:hypothetical protein